MSTPQGQCLTISSSDNDPVHILRSPCHRWNEFTGTHLPRNCVLCGFSIPEAPNAPASIYYARYSGLVIPFPAFMKTFLRNRWWRKEDKSSPTLVSPAANQLEAPPVSSSSEPRIIQTPTGSAEVRQCFLWRSRALMRVSK